eukprot:Rmarinus@m.5007
MMCESCFGSSAKKSTHVFLNTFGSICILLKGTRVLRRLAFCPRCRHNARLRASRCLSTLRKGHPALLHRGLSSVSRRGRFLDLPDLRSAVPPPPPSSLLRAGASSASRRLIFPIDC